jgi:class 3 adenylate cyclase/predicted ATPase
MTIIEVLDQVRELLQSKGRVTYRVLQVQFALNDASLAALKEELIEAERVAVDENGKVLVWIGTSPVSSSTFQVSGSQPHSQVASSTFQVSSSQPPVPSPRSPVSYTPKHLAERILAEQAAMEARGVTDGERKTITALFVDIKGSMALMEELDPEDARSIVDPALQLMMEAVHRYEGYVSQSTGDGIFAFFGAPIAHEDHPQRALYAALRMQEEISKYADTLRLAGRPPLQIRVGVNTGEVVLRSIRKDDLHADYTPIGHSTGLAQRMESLAKAGSIVVSEHTHKLIEGYFEFKALGAAQVKGVSGPINIYEVVGVGPLRTRLQVAARRGLVRFVGRQSELEQMRRALDLAKEGHGQIVAVMGEPGVGKSRLCHEFKLLSQRGCLVLETFSVSHGKAYAYLPLIDLLKNYFQIALQDDERKRREKITGKVLTLDRSLEDILPYLFFLLGLAEPTSSLQQMDPQIRQRRTLDAIKRLLVRESLNQPLILEFEDLHWLDTETQEFLTLLSESVATARILLLVNYRPEYRHEWGNKTYYTQLRLDPLGRAEAEEMLTALLGDNAVLQPLKRFILEKTEGNPFFMEEIVQALIEQGVLVRDDVGAGLRPAPTMTLADLRIPTTVQGILTSRIDRLPPAEKEILLTLAVIGKEFPFSLLRQVVSQPEDALHRFLAHLQAAEFIYEQPAFPEPEYTFKHALTQEVAYGTVLQERRKALHERTAQAIESLYNSKVEDHYSELAYHYTRSSNTEKAVEYLHLAGQQAVQRSANAEAITHLTTALELLNALPDTPERVQQELGLHLALGPALMNIRGFAAPEVEALYTRARELCQQVGDTPQLFRVLFGLWGFSFVRAELPLARELGEQMMRLAQQAQDSALLLGAHRVLGATLLQQGEMALAREHLEQGITLYNPQQHRSLAFVYGGMDMGIMCRIHAAWALWFLGYPDQALQRGQEGITLAYESSHPYSLSFTLQFTANLHQFRREWRLVQERAEAAMALSAEQGFAMILSQAAIRRGGALAEQGQEEEGIAQIRQGLVAYQATGAKLAEPYFLAQLAEAHGKVGQVEEGLSVLAEALALTDKTGQRFWEAELYRIKGELSLQSRSPKSEVEESSESEVRGPKSELTNPRPLAPDLQAEAEACFLKAIEIACKQSAKSLELRAVMSLVRLRQQQAAHHASRTTQHEARTMLDAARNMLSEIYTWFTEGFDTKDLQEAKTLLEELEGPKPKRQARRQGKRKGAGAVKK